METKNFTVRKATIDDCDIILHLIALLAEYEKEPESAIATKEDLLKYGFTDNPLFYCILAEIEGNVIGFALYFLTFSTWQGKPGIYLEDLFVIPAYRGLGIGKALMKTVAQHGVEMNCTRMTWQVLDWNTPAIDFYQRCGARHLSEWFTYRLEGDSLRNFAADNTSTIL